MKEKQLWQFWQLRPHSIESHILLFISFFSYLVWSKCGRNWNGHICLCFVTNRCEDSALILRRISYSYTTWCYEIIYKSDHNLSYYFVVRIKGDESFFLQKILIYMVGADHFIFLFFQKTLFDILLLKRSNNEARLMRFVSRIAWTGAVIYYIQLCDTWYLLDESFTIGVVMYKNKNKVSS